MTARPTSRLRVRTMTMGMEPPVRIEVRGGVGGQQKGAGLHNHLLHPPRIGNELHRLEEVEEEGREAKPPRRGRNVVFQLNQRKVDARTAFSWNDELPDYVAPAKIPRILRDVNFKVNLIVLEEILIR